MERQQSGVAMGIRLSSIPAKQVPIARVAADGQTLERGRVVSYKHEQRIEAARSEARNKHLDFLVGQTARSVVTPSSGTVGTTCKRCSTTSTS